MSRTHGSYLWEPIPVSTGMGLAWVWVWVQVELPMGYPCYALACRWFPLHPPLYQLHPLCCLPRHPISALISPWHCKDPRSCTSFCPWARHWEPFLQWHIYFNSIHTSRGGGSWWLVAAAGFSNCIAIGNILPAPLV